MQVSVLDPSLGSANYFIGNDSAKWLTNIPTYAKVKYSNVYPGIDLVYYGNQRQLEYDFVVAPNADPKQARLHFAGASKLKLNDSGDLEILAKDGEIALHKPVVYQVKDGQRQLVEGNFRLMANNTVGFTLASYDRSRELVVDPVLAYSTFLGGSYDDFLTSIALDVQGNAVIVGMNLLTNFPVTSGAYQKTVKDMFVTKLNTAGATLIYSTYLGSTNSEDPRGVAVDASGNAYITGSTYSTDYPVTPGALKTLFHHDAGAPTGFVTKLNAAGSGLVYSTYLGGGATDLPSAISVDTDNRAYVTGTTLSPDYPITAGVVQPVSNALKNGLSSIFVMKLGSLGGGLIYSTYLGGSQPTAARRLLPPRSTPDRSRFPQPRPSKQSPLRVET
ncbi:Cell surface protein [Acidisarcina polymorpha]|uniref:Cell surface protein n=1 Tax=Acidisarcina polymorpha TaxID=2211140 RepID=A0A2Z5FVE0_9BACT|nr:SBBP repeat-containing protein [Acidisarcina polymorpha]AXC10325.1 Cell surface protein [Acidisarcina polymorpha]